MSRAGCPQQWCPAVRRGVTAGWELCPHPLPRTSVIQKHLKHNLPVYDPCVAHLVLPGKEKPISYLLPPAHLMLINPSIYSRCTGEKSFQLVAT